MQSTIASQSAVYNAAAVHVLAIPPKSLLLTAELLAAKSDIITDGVSPRDTRLASRRLPPDTFTVLGQCTSRRGVRLWSATLHHASYRTSDKSAVPAD